MFKRQKVRDSAMYRYISAFITEGIINLSKTTFNHYSTHLTMMMIYGIKVICMYEINVVKAIWKKNGENQTYEEILHWFSNILGICIIFSIMQCF